MHSRLIAPLATLFLLSVASAQTAPTPGSGPSARDIEQRLDVWKAQHGASWQIALDESSGYATFLYGGSAAPLFPPLSESDFLVLARDAATATQGLHGVDVATLVDDDVIFAPLSFAGSSDKYGVQFRQIVNGVEVLDGFMNVLFAQDGTLLAVDTTAQRNLEGFSTQPRVSEASAKSFANLRFQAETSMEATELRGSRLVVRSSHVGEFDLPTLAWEVELHTVTSSGEAHGFAYYVDAQNGTLIERQARVHNCFDVSGTLQTMATPGLFPDLPSNPETAQNMVRATVTSPQGNAVTDANGFFNIVGASAPLSVTTRYQGTWATVSGTISLVSNLVAASGNTILMNSPVVDTQTSQANAFIWINKLHDWAKSIAPTDPLPDFLATANVNIGSSCNAFYNGSSINFYLPGGGCPNTSYSSVVCHELGHWYNVRYGSGNGSDGFGEGGADIWAMYLCDDPVVGKDFCGTGCVVRTGLNMRQFCGDSNPGCHGGVHADGEVLMGAMWKMRANLKNSLGASAGAMAADALNSGWFRLYNDTQIKTIIETHLLTLDDNDGNILNGTPNFTAIDSAFRTQGFPGVTLATVGFSNVTDLPDTANQIGPYTVNADVTALLSPPLTTVQLKYRVNGGAFNTVNMSNVGGDTYTANIPGQPCPNKIDYYVQGTNSSSGTNTFPANAPTGVLDFQVGVVNIALADNFQTNLGWTTSIAGATSGQWQRGVPVNDPSWAYDPAADGDGSGQCYLTQNTVGNTDVDGGSVTLTSPVFDLTGGGASISYKYFLNLTNADGTDRLLVQASSNGDAGPWVQVGLHTTNGALAWRDGAISQAQLTAAGLAMTANMKLRFTANDSGTASIVEAGVDAVDIRSVTCSVCPTPAIYCSAKFNSLGCLPDIGAFGTASATAGSGFVVFCDGIMNNKSGLLFYGINGANSLPFQGGTLCVASPIKRTPAISSGGTPPPANDCSGQFVIDMNAFAVGALGGTPLPELQVSGTVVHTQWWGRDPGFPAPNNTTLSGGLSYTICD